MRIFFKEFRWHLACFVPYTYLGILIWDVLVILTSALTGNGFSYKFELAIVPVVMPGGGVRGATVYWMIGIAVAMAAIVYTAIVLQPPANRKLRRTLAMAGVLMPASTPIQILHVCTIWGRPPSPIIWIVSVAAGMAALWLVVGEFLRDREEMRPWKQRILPTAGLAIAFVFCVTIAAGDICLPYRAASWTWTRVTAGPVSAALRWERDAHALSRRARRRIHDRMMETLPELVEKYPDDPAAAKARAMLARQRARAEARNPGSN